jgi:uncharacterized membrane protein
MFKSARANSITAVAAAVVVASLAVFSFSAAQEAYAEPRVTNALQQPLVKGDRPRNPKGAACSALGWPHYEQTCQFDRRMPADEAKTVRIIALR